MKALPSPLNDSLRVRNIANFDLITCDVGDNPEQVLDRTELAEYDQIPVRDSSRIVGVLERQGHQIRQLDDAILVSADEPLSNFIYTVRHQPYRLVVDGTAITGVVTWSDLLKTPVLLLGYSLLARLEVRINETIHQRYGNSENWLPLLDANERNAIQSRKAKAKKENLTLSIVELADLVHKAKAVKESLPPERNFESDLESVRKFRNAVAHVHRFMRSNADLNTFVDRLETVTAWLNALQSDESAKPAASSR